MKITKKELEETIEKIERNSKNWPEGYIIVRKKPHIQYLQVINGKEIYISIKNVELIKRLCQKKYESDMLKVAREDLLRLKKNKILVEPDEPYSKMDIERKKFVKPFFVSDEDFKKQWQSKGFESSKIPFENGFFVTNRGEHVRSKSEILIANTLDKMNCAYFYERPLKLSSYTVNPDFTVLNPKTRREIIWEHFGMMSEENYRLNSWHKIHSYIEQGYIIGKNLIVTFEEKNFPLQIKDIEIIIKNYFC